MLMQWLLLLLVAGWIIGMVLLVCFPRFLLRPLPSGTGMTGKKRKRILLLVAHPDDECMFFGPTLLSLTMEPAFDVHVLSISSGNVDGLGDLRKLEMVSSCSVLKVPAENVLVLDHPALQDGHAQEWSHLLLVEIIKQTVESQKIDVVSLVKHKNLKQALNVITFDSHGVSGHPNHSALSHALRCEAKHSLLEDNCLIVSAKRLCERFLSSYLLKRKFDSCQDDVRVLPVEGWELVSLNIARKYSGVLEICFSTLGWLLSRKKSEVHCFVTPNPVTSVAAMKQHQSQWVWFRRLFVVFAAYTYVNTMRRIDSEPRAAYKSK